MKTWRCCWVTPPRKNGMAVMTPSAESFDIRKTADPNLQVPDLTEAREGWRMWTVSTKIPRYGVSPKLFSATSADYYWTPRRASVAECQYHCGQTPGENCSCGFYSAKTLEQLWTL